MRERLYTRLNWTRACRHSRSYAMLPDVAVGAIQITFFWKATFMSDMILIYGKE